MTEQENKADDGVRRFKLGDLKLTGARTDFSTPVLRGFNMGNGTLSLTLTMEQFRENSDVANELRILETGGQASEIAQRPLDEKHARAIALYMLRGLVVTVRNNWVDEGREIPTELDDMLSELGEGPYQALQPFTGNIRNCAAGGADLDLEMRSDGKLVLFLRQGQIIYVIDGQHRRHAYEMLRIWLGDVTQTARYKKRGIFIPDDLPDDGRLSSVELEIWNAVLHLTRSHFTVDVTVHLGLKPEQEKQLFHDLNNLGKKPDAALAQAFDNANPISVFIRKEIEAPNLLGSIRIADSGSKKGKRKAEEVPTIYRDDLASSNALLFAGATNQAGIIGSVVLPNQDYGRRFWKAVAVQDHFGADRWEERTILAEAVAIKALAQLAYNFHGSREKDLDLRDRFLSALEDKEINFEHKDPLWALYFKNDAERAELDPKLDDYLTPDAGRKSYAVWQGDQLSFASNTRDIARYLGDLMRWKLNLPPRPGIAQLKTKLIKDGKMAAPARSLAAA